MTVDLSCKAVFGGGRHLFSVELNRVYNCPWVLNPYSDRKCFCFERVWCNFRNHQGQPLEKRRCPIDGKTVKHCIGCPTCAIMNGFGGAGAFSDGKYNLTNDFGGTLYEYIGKKQAMELMHYVDEINVSHGGENTKLYSTANSAFKTRCLQCGLHLLDASVRHLGTDVNLVVLSNLYDLLKDKVQDVRLSNRLTDSACCLVEPEWGMSQQMQRLMKAMKQEVPDVKPILEINPSHPLIAAMRGICEKDATSARITDCAELLLDQARLMANQPIDNPLEFARKVSQLMADSLEAKA